MQAIEFETQIDENGHISIPEQFHDAYGKHARLVVLLPDKDEPARKQRQPGSAKGTLVLLSVDEGHLDDFAEYIK